MRKALVVGIDDYSSCPLQGCVNDADAIANILENNGDNSPNFSIKKYNNIQKKGDLRKHVDELFSGDTVNAALFYFSGHGHRDKSGSYLVTPDCCSHDWGMSMVELLTLANTSKIKNKIIILDCCFSGGVGSPCITGDTTVTEICEGITILTASKNDEPSREIGGHGVFTTLLLSALDGGAADIMGNITPGSVYAYIDQALGPWDQRPVFKTNVKEFLKLRNVIPKVPKEKLRNIAKYFSTPKEYYPLNPSYEFMNDPEKKHSFVKPYANKDNIEIFKDLQEFTRAGLVEPVGEEHMYFAAMHSRCCRLTPIGQYYWDLIKKKRF